VAAVETEEARASTTRTMAYQIGGDDTCISPTDSGSKFAKVLHKGGGSTQGIGTADNISWFDDDFDCSSWDLESMTLQTHNVAIVRSGRAYVGLALWSADPTDGEQATLGSGSGASGGECMYSTMSDGKLSFDTSSGEGRLCILVANFS
jgi:hypothetical protein